MGALGNVVLVDVGQVRPEPLQVAAGRRILLEVGYQRTVGQSRPFGFAEPLEEASLSAVRYLFMFSGNFRAFLIEAQIGHGQRVLKDNQRAWLSPQRRHHLQRRRPWRGRDAGKNVVRPERHLPLDDDCN